MMPSSPLIGRRSGTSSPNMDRIDVVKDNVIGELASRIGRPIPEFNKNKRGSSGGSDCELAIVLSPVPRRKISEVKDTTEAENPREARCHEVRPIPAAAIRAAHLQPTSASAPSSPRLGLRRPQQQITITTSATLKLNKQQDNSPRDRSKSPAVNRLAAPNTSSRSSSTPRRSRPSPSPTRRSNAQPTTSTAAGHTSVRMSTKRKSPASGTRLAAPGSLKPGLNRSISADPRAKNGGYSRSMSAEPDLNDPAIKARLGNRATKTVEKSVGKCGVCKKAVGMEGCTAFGKVYHKECFKCSSCRRKIDGKFFERSDKPYCDKCYAKITEICVECKQPIKGDCIEAGKNFYHPRCMRCFVCNDVLMGQFLIYEDKPICERDYKLRAEKCAECGEPIIGTCYTMNNKNYCEEHYRAKCDNCPKCDQQITGHMVRTANSAFHPECFTCIGCNKDLAHAEFVMDELRQVFCPECFAKKKAPRCATCKKPIVPGPGQKKAPRLRALGKDYHPDCFKCEDCGLVLDARIKGRECYPMKNHIYCFKCNRKKFSSDESESDDE